MVDVSSFGAIGPQAARDACNARNTRPRPWAGPQTRRVPTLSWDAMNRCLDLATDSRAYSQNEVFPLFNGPDGWPTRLHNLADAKVILIKTYEFIDDEAGRIMVAQLKARAKAGATVVVQYDFKGSAEFPRYTTLRRHPRVLWPLLGEPNVVLVHCYMPKHWQYLAIPCCHKKYFITFAPGKPATLLMGGMNIANSYRVGGVRCEGKHRIHGYRDTDVLVRGPVVKEAVDDFLADLRKRVPADAQAIEAAVCAIEGPRTYEPSPKGAQTRIVTSLPRDKISPNRMPKMFNTLLQNVPAGETVYISSAFFSPLKTTRQAMRDAAARGVRIVILNNAPRVHDNFGTFIGFIAHGVMRRLIRQVPEGSMRLFEWYSSPQDNLCSLHQKIAIFGNTGPVWIGSANLDPISADSNHESVLLVQDPTLRIHVRRRFEDDLRRQNVKEVTQATFNQESWFRRYIEKIALMIFRKQV